MKTTANVSDCGRFINLVILCFPPLASVTMAKSITKEGDSLDGLEGDMGALHTSENSENYIIVDIGANLTNKKFTRDLDSVVSRARDAGGRLSCVVFKDLKSITHSATKLVPELAAITL